MMCEVNHEKEEEVSVKWNYSAYLGFNDGCTDECHISYGSQALTQSLPVYRSQGLPLRYDNAPGVGKAKRKARVTKNGTAEFPKAAVLIYKFFLPRYSKFVYFFSIGHSGTCFLR